MGTPRVAGTGLDDDDRRANQEVALAAGVRFPVSDAARVENQSRQRQGGDQTNAAASRLGYRVWSTSASGWPTGAGGKDTPSARTSFGADDSVVTTVRLGEDARSVEYAVRGTPAAAAGLRWRPAAHRSGRPSGPRRAVPQGRGGTGDQDSLEHSLGATADRQLTPSLLPAAYTGLNTRSVSSSERNRAPVYSTGTPARATARIVA